MLFDNIRLGMVIDMKKILNVIVVITMILSVLVSTGCDEDSKITKEQEQWIEQFCEWYPDDEFTYEGHAKELLGAIDENTIVVKSEKFGEFAVFERDGELNSVYPYLRHNEAIEKHYADEVESFFECDDIKVYYPDRLREVPSEALSDEEFIEQYTGNYFTVTLYYDDAEYPSQDEIVKATLRLVDHIGGCEINIRFSDPETATEDHPYDHEYMVKCDNDGHIRCLNHWLQGQATDPEEIIKDEDLADALEVYAT